MSIRKYMACFMAVNRHCNKPARIFTKQHVHDVHENVWMHERHGPAGLLGKLVGIQNWVAPLVLVTAPLLGLSFSAGTAMDLDWGRGKDFPRPTTRFDILCSFWVISNG